MVAMTRADIAALTSSDNQEWETPASVYDPLHRMFGFTLDAAASVTNAKCPRYLTREDDGLAQDWGRETVWLNPPYSHGKRPGPSSKWLWTRKACYAAAEGATVVLLLPNDTDARHWCDWVLRASEVWFVCGRISFELDGRPVAGNTHGSAIVVYQPDNLDRPEGPRHRYVTRDMRFLTE